MVEGKVVEEGKLVGRGRAYRPHGDFIAGAVASAGGWWCTWWGVGIAEEGGAGQGGQMANVSYPHTNIPVHHTYLKGADFWCFPPAVGVEGPLWLCSGLLSALVPAEGGPGRYHGDARPLPNRASVQPPAQRIPFTSELEPV